MSQIYISGESSNPRAPTSIVTDDGTAIPVNNELAIFGGSLEEDNPNGIKTDVFPDGPEIINVNLTNRIEAEGFMSGVFFTTLVSFALGASPAVYKFSFAITCVDIGSIFAYTFSSNLFATFKTDGTTATIVGAQSEVHTEDAFDTFINIEAGPAGPTQNTVLLKALGASLSSGLYKVVGTYIKAS